MTYTIPRWDTREAIWSGEADSPRDAIEMAIRAGVLFYRADLRGTDLRGAILADALLSGAYLMGARLTGAHLGCAHLGGSRLTGAILTDADLRGAYLGGADLRDADLRGSDLRGADLRDSTLAGANLTGADLTDANIIGVGLGGAILTGATIASGLTWDALRAEVDPRELRRRVADHIELHPELHDQREWGDDSADDCGTPCCVAGWACRLGGGARGMHISAAATLMLHIDGLPMPSFDSDASREDILAALRAEVTP